VNDNASCGHPSIRRPSATLGLAASARAARSSLRRTPRPRHLLPPVGRCSPRHHARDLICASRGPLAAAIPLHTTILRAASALSIYLSIYLSLSILRPLTMEHLPSLFPNPQQHHRDASPQSPLPMAAGRMWRGASSRPRLRQGLPRARRMLVVLVCYRSSLAPTLTTKIDQPMSPLPYVANVCIKCFRGML
jgi:hypothetical protein